MLCLVLVVASKLTVLLSPPLVAYFFFFSVPLHIHSHQLIIVTERRRKMLQFPAFMTQYPSTTSMIPSSVLLPTQWPHPQSDELLLAMEESDLQQKYDEIRKTNSNLVVIGKTSIDNDKEEFDNDADDDEADHVEESEGDDFEQETG